MEPRFKVWIKSKNKWVDDGEPTSPYNSLCNSFGENDLVWKQFSGRKDVNGKDVYEGDLIKVSYKMDDHGDLETYESEVLFDHSAFGDKFDYFCNYDFLPSFRMEVIGNIFDGENQ